MAEKYQQLLGVALLITISEADAIIVIDLKVMFTVVLAVEEVGREYVCDLQLQSCSCNRQR